MKLTRELIMQGRSRNGGWSRDQLALFGVKWPLKHGWIDRIVGKEFPDGFIKAFLALKDAHLEPDIDAAADDHLRSIANGNY